MRSLRAGAKLSAAVALTLILVLGLARTAAAQNAVAGDPPLTFGNNFFVTGDYVVAGAQGMTSNFTFINSTQYAIGTITVPDLNPGIKPSVITGTNAVPTGAQIVAAILYWQTVEKTGVMPGQPGSGQNGFFRPLIAGGVNAPGYQISGVQLNPLGSNAVSWSSGGCTSGSTGKVVRTYRTSVLGYLPIDSNGNVTPNVQYEVRLPGTSSTTPIAVGASLILIYRVISPNFPLNSIVIYDGDFATNATSVAAMTMTQAMQGFYDAETDLTQHPGAKLESRLTHIVGNGKTKKTETVSLNGQALPSFYPLGHPSFPPYTGAQPPFPGFYGTWDNPTWTFDPGKTYVNLSNPIGEHSGSARTQVAASGANPGCVDWGATIVSTTVNNSDGDGILDVWKVPEAPNANTPGYCDASVNEGSCHGPGDPAWVDLPGAVHGEKDVFIQLDYMCSSPNGMDSCATGDGTNYSFDPRQTGADVMMTNAFSAQGIHLHINPVNLMGTTQPVHAIQELTCMDNSNNPLCASVNANGLTPFPNQPGVVGWKAGFEFIQSQPLNYPDEISCEEALNGPCIRRFQPGRKDSYHYALFAHAIGTPTWGLQGGSLASVTAFPNGDIKFTTSAPHGLVVDPHLGNGRVTIADAITNPNLNGTYKVTSVNPPAGVLNITGTSMSALGIATYTFTQVSGPAPAPGELVTVTNTTNGNTVFNVGNATIASVSGSTFTVNFNVNGFTPSAIAAQPETGGCAPAFPTRACALTNSAPFYFTINITPSTVNTQTSYTELTDPNLTVTSGQASTVSGFSDIGGADTLVTLGLWGNPAFNGSSAGTSPVSDGQKEPVQAGTFMHELGHTLGLTHGGLFFDNVAHNPPDYTPTFDANCKSNYQSVMNYLFQTDLLGPSNTLDFSSQQLDTLNENLLFPIALGGSPGAVKFQTTTWYDLTPSLVGSKAKHHCDGSPAFFNANVPPFSADVTPIMYPHLNQALPNPFWSAKSLDINFNGTIDAGFRGYDDWANVDLRQIGASGPDLGGAGRSGGGPGRSGGGPGRSGGGPGKEIDFATANDVTRPPRNLMVTSEDGSPRFIHLSWTAPIFGQIGAYRIYRSADGGATFALLATVPGGQLTYTDMTDACIQPKRFEYFVTAVLAGTFAMFPPGPTEGQESEPSNTVSAGSDGSLTGCYVVPSFSSPASAVQGSQVQITWTLTDDFNTAGAAVTRQAANTLVAIGPGLLSNNCTPGRTTLLADGVPTTPLVDSFMSVSNQFTFTWNNTDAFCSGSYTFELDLDHVSGSPAQVQPDATQLLLAIDVGDTDTTPHIAPALTVGTVGLAYNYPITEHGGTGPFTWTFTGSLPQGITLNPVSGLLSGTTCAAGNSNFTAMVTDSKSNSGTQPLTLQINKANTTTGVTSSANPSVFQQMVTFTVTVAPQYSCTPTGTVTLLDAGTPIPGASNLSLNGGMATFTTSALSVGNHSITASYGGDGNFNGSMGSLTGNPQVVNKANTTITINLVSPSPAFVGQPITVAYTIAVVPLGAGTPIVPTGTVTVAASDLSGCVVPVPGPGMCTLSPSPTTAGNVTFTVTYSGDGNFVGFVANGNYNVYQLVFTTQPSNRGVGLTITPAVVVTAEDSTNSTLTTFTGGITLAIGAGPGTLSGTTTQTATSGVATFGDLSINKIANGYTLTASPAGGVPAATSNAFNVDTFYVDGNGNFGTLDLPTGTVTRIGSAAVTGSNGIDLTPGLQVYAYNASNQLMRITPSTGAATLVGTGTIPDQATTGALTDGSYFGIDAVTGNLYSINLATGATTSVGPTSAAVLPAGCTVEASLTGSANVLYYTIGYSGASCSSPMSDTLYQIDPTSGTTTLIGGVTVNGSGVNEFVGSAFVGGTLYGFTSGGQEYTINPATGMATLLANTTPTTAIFAAGSSQ